MKAELDNPETIAYLLSATEGGDMKGSIRQRGSALNVRANFSPSRN